MKGFRRAAVLLLVASLFIVIAFTVVAETENVYTGNVGGLTTVLSNYQRANSQTAKEKALDAALKYADTVNPEEAGYSEALAMLDAYELDFANKKLTAVTEADGAKDKYTALEAVNTFVGKHPILETTEGAAEFYTSFKKSAVEITELFLAESKVATAAADKHSAIDAIAFLLANYNPAVKDDFQADFELESFACAKLYLSAIDFNLNLAENGVSVRRLRNFLKDHSFSGEIEGASEFEAECNLKFEQYEEAYLANMQSVFLGAYTDDYSATVRIDLNFDEDGIGKMVTEKNIESGKEVTYIGVDCACGFSKNPTPDGEHSEWCGNKYYTVRYDKAKTHFRARVNPNNITKSLVFECDFTTFDKLPDTNVWFDDTGAANNTSWDITYFSIAPNGDIVRGKDGEVLLAGAITPGEWTHISMVIDYVTNDVKLYVDYVQIATLSNKSSTYGYHYTPQMVRIGANPNTAGSSFSLDNVKLYGGYAPRDLDWYSNLTNEEKFIYNVSQLSNKKLPASAIKQYHVAANMSAVMYWAQGDYTFDATLAENAALKAAVDAFLAFDVDKVVERMGKDNLEQLRYFYDRLTSVDKCEDTVKLRKYWLSEFDNYHGSLGGIIELCDEYSNIIKNVGKIRENIAVEERAEEFTVEVNSFYTSAAFTRQLAAYERARELYPTLDLEVLNDKVAYAKFYDAYARYDDMPTVLAENQLVENSKLLYACLTYIAPYSTEQEWKEHYDEISYYVESARRIINVDGYDIYYKDISEMVERFAPMDAYFYTVLQQKHIAHVTAELERYEASNFYFEQFGILKALDNYFNENDVDYTNVEIAALYATVKSEIEELLLVGDEYDSLLNENSARFIEKCQNLLGSKDYLTIKSAISDASIYFYNMDVSNAEAKDALAIYILREKEIRATEAYANEFIEAVFELTLRQENVLAGVIECYAYLDTVERAVAGVTNAIKTLESYMASYTEQKVAINNELKNISTYVVAAQNTSGRAAISAYAQAVIVK